MADDLVQKLRDSATWISDNIYLDGHAGYSNLRHAAADEIESLRAQADEMAEALDRCASRMRGKPQWDSEDAGPCQTLQLVEAALARYRGEGM